MLLGDHVFHDLQSLLNKSIEDIKNEINTKKTFIDDYLDRLLNADDKKLLDGLSIDQLDRLMKELIKSMQTIDLTLNVYSYALNRTLRGHLIKFRETADLCIRSLSAHIVNKKDGDANTSMIFSIFLKQMQEFQNMKKY